MPYQQFLTPWGRAVPRYSIPFTPTLPLPGKRRIPRPAPMPPGRVGQLFLTRYPVSVPAPAAPTFTDLARMFATRAYAGGGRLVLQEPSVLTGIFSGVPYALVGEAGPEQLDIKPLRRFARGGKVVSSGTNPFGTWTTIDYGQRKVTRGSNVARTAERYAQPGGPLRSVFYDEQGNPVLSAAERARRAKGLFRNLKRLKGLPRLHR